MTIPYPRTQLFINGHWREGATQRALPVYNPATGHPIGEVACAEAPDLQEVAEAVANGFQVWRRISAFERYKIMRKAATLLRDRIELIAQLMTQEQGKPLAEARMEINAGADTIDWFAEEGRRAYGRVIPARQEGVYQLVVQEPVGPVAAFTPWNFPIVQVARKLRRARVDVVVGDGLPLAVLKVEAPRRGVVRVQHVREDGPRAAPRVHARAPPRARVAAPVRSLVRVRVPPKLHRRARLERVLQGVVDAVDHERVKARERRDRGGRSRMPEGVNLRGGGRGKR